MIVNNKIANLYKSPAESPRLVKVMFMEVKHSLRHKIHYSKHHNQTFFNNVQWDLEGKSVTEENLFTEG